METSRKQPKCILISPYEEIHSYGVRSLASYLKERGIRTSIIFAPIQSRFSAYILNRVNHVFPAEVIADMCRIAADATCIGISLMTDHFCAVAEITKELRRNLPTVPIMWGGIHPTLLPEPCSRHADFVCVGEGYEAACELIQRLDEGERFPAVPGIGYTRDDKYFFHGVRQPLGDLDTLPFVDYSTDDHFLKIGNSLRPMTSSLMNRFLGFWYTTFFSYGCPFHCTYCCNSFLHKLHPMYRRVRKHSPDYIADEIAFIRKMHPFIRMVKFNDDSFMSLSVAEISRFSDRQHHSGVVPFVATGCNPALVTEEKIALLVEAGLRRTRIGIQSGNERILKEIYGRKTYKEAILRSARILARHSKKMVPTAYDVILDNPWEKPEELMDTFHVVSALDRPFSLNLYSLRPYPKTVIYERAHKDGLMGVEEIDQGLVRSYSTLGNTYLNCLIAVSGLISIPRFFARFLLSKRLVARNPPVPRFIIRALSTMIKMQKVYHHISKRDVTMLPFFIARMLRK